MGGPVPERVEVIVDALSPRFGGGLTYLTEQLAALARVDPALGVTILAAPANASAFTALGVGRVRTVPVGPLRPVVEQALLPLLRGASRGGAPAVLYCPGNFAPLAPTRLPIVLTLQNPNFFGLGRRAAHNRSPDRRLRSLLARASAARATEVIVISAALRDELARDLPAVAARATLLPSGRPTWPDQAVRPATLPAEIDDFVLCLANDAPHKRLDLVVEAWNLAVRDDPEPVPLVLAGRSFDPDRPGRLRAAVDPASRRYLVQLGPVHDRRQVRWLLDRARAMVAAAILEAHPLTPAEAGSRGCPLVLSDIPPHREVAGGHARYVPPDDARALARVLRDLPPRPPDGAWDWPVSWDDNAAGLASALRRAARTAAPAPVPAAVTDPNGDHAAHRSTP